MINIRRAAAQRFFLDDLAGLTLGPDKQNRAFVGGQLAHELERVEVERQRLFEVDDVDFVAMAENERGHFGVPVAGLVSEMDPTLQHFTHASCHNISS